MLFVLKLAAISSLFFFSVIILPLQEASLFLPRGNRKDVEKNYKSGSVCSQPHHLQKPLQQTASELEKKNLLLSPPCHKQNKKQLEDYFAEQTERMKTEEPVYYLSSRKAAHFKAQSL